MICFGYKLVRLDLNSLSAGGKYRLHYALGATVSAVSNTLGIMVFDTYDNAIDFACYLSFRYSILLAAYNSDNIDEHTGFRNSGISIGTSELALQYYYDNSLHVYTRLMPRGTILCPRVKVIAKEEVMPQ